MAQWTEDCSSVRIGNIHLGRESNSYSDVVTGQTPQRSELTR
jgi:hypothetical protein